MMQAFYPKPQDIMRPCRRYFQSPFDVLLPLDVRKILMIDRLLLKQRLDIAQGVWDRLRSVKKTNGLGQGRHPEDRHVLNDGGLSSILGWHDHALQPGLAQRQCHRHGSSNSL